MINLSMKQLRYFDALARTGHFGRAAEDCAISQPALSVQIREMEETMGAALFERGPRQVHLTALGAAMVPRVRAILRGVDELSDLARAAQGPLSGRLRLGVIPTIAPYLLPGLVAGLVQSHPGLDVAPREAVTGKLIAALTEAQLDAAILALPVSEPSLAEVPLFTEDFVLVRPATEAGKPVPSAEALPQMRLLLLEEGHCFRDQALEFCKVGGVTPRTVMEGSSLATLTQMVGAGIGVTLLPEIALPVETRSAAVSVARLAAPAPARRVGLVWRRSSPLAEQLTEVAAVIARIGTALRDRAREA
ncbi:hydrogen peroxide-inducible genes activator [Rhodobacter capsulatus]|jgi:LysR family hydrogen peroxide-inducible transcriptional activator|uniref:Hydrogen peroxide-inducible genes activator n=1 Tax=Rhodobacter capsulatus (strain ATCC BAA-309 / NBRC 16581 / SB1003) TaxID=272942 RepID=D5AU43_RHOCB|nr:hydrogen peroxide-inducible genes activator [Rhodobacter capsulatus]ADE85482.1 hydrogen peroxide-inducible genes activator [Rhodobacter capsulatus SB 1003]ETD01517.1 LysR family transcriptional regulator [Rhodobacter capsulatus DE442]ETD76584.1 LysR family transcriptional regulator [Rhodobacter capsulatus R121]ETE53421.1 LysR family transcriptional regulator [Rhodobacter capsulatus Y262]MDS0927193.1 hydrogen peroxide-inducible genes activator [Rhodobacter capsulatus]